jgi:hypothetical protein
MNQKTEILSIFDEIEQRAFEEGLRQAREESKEWKQNVAIRSWENGIPLYVISNITLLPVSEIEKIIADYQQPHKL